MSARASALDEKDAERCYGGEEKKNKDVTARARVSRRTAPREMIAIFERERI